MYTLFFLNYFIIIFNLKNKSTYSNVKNWHVILMNLLTLKVFLNCLIFTLIFTAIILKFFLVNKETKNQFLWFFLFLNYFYFILKILYFRVNDHVFYHSVFITYLNKFSSFFIFKLLLLYIYFFPLSEYLLIL